MTVIDENEGEIRTILSRPYVRRLRPDETGGFTATIQEFPGCIAEGETAEEVMRNLDEAAASWLAGSLADGYPIAEPIEASLYSGRIALRIPAGLHEDIAVLAELDECSVNQLLAVAISEYVGRRQGLPPARVTKKKTAHKRDMVETELVTK